MKTKWLLACLLGSSLAVAQMPATAPADASRVLAFRIDEGHNVNSFLRGGPVAAHLLLRSGNDPRILVAFPAGNSGVGLWFGKTGRPVAWTLLEPPKSVTARDAKGRPLHGIEFEAEVDAALQPRAAVLSSVRVLRDYELQASAPAEVMVAPRVEGTRISWMRERLDAAAGYALEIAAVGDARLSAREFAPAAGKPLRLRVRALTGETPLTPLAPLLTPRAADDTRARQALAFLSYREKYLAGSWRFDTYFGRDTLISALLLAPVLEPEALESAISSVLDRLAPNGEVAHEEDIGEFAVLRNAREGRGRVDTPIYDYGMVDDDFLLAPLAACWLLDDPRGRVRAREFLGERVDGESRGRQLARNLAWLVERAAAFAHDPRVANLVGLKDGRMTGNWRDSEQGLARGRYAYDINAALVPAALDAAARLHESGILQPHLEGRERATLAQARQRADAWSRHAPAMFRMEVPARRAREAVSLYAKDIGVDAERAVDALPDQPLEFHALALDETGRPIPILHSDEGFRLLLGAPAPEEIERCITAIMRPFPAGLLTDAGLLVANPALAPRELQREFDRFAYHGTVIWSWQQALLAAGLERQLRRTDLPPPLRVKIAKARADLWAVIGHSSALRTSELWSWSFVDGRYRIEAFGRPGADVDESNAAQLWSTVYLGLDYQR